MMTNKSWEKPHNTWDLSTVSEAVDFLLKEVASLVPEGTIVKSSKTLEEFMSIGIGKYGDWRVCDGQNGTVDMTDKYATGISSIDDTDIYPGKTVTSSVSAEDIQSSVSVKNSPWSHLAQSDNFYGTKTTPVLANGRIPASSVVNTNGYTGELPGHKYQLFCDNKDSPSHIINYEFVSDSPYLKIKSRKIETINPTITEIKNVSTPLVGDAIATSLRVNDRNISLKVSGDIVSGCNATIEKNKDAATRPNSTYVFFYQKFDSERKPF